MLHLQQLVDAWEESHRELQIALEGLPNKDVWVRAAPSLLSVGELAGHIAFGEAALATKPWNAEARKGEIPIKSPLVDFRFHYYPSSVHDPVDLGLGAIQIAEELALVHAQAKEIVSGLNPQPSDLANGSDRATWENVLQYMGFHVAYHTGQVYTVRHLLGHETEDN